MDQPISGLFTCGSLQVKTFGVIASNFLGNCWQAKTLQTILELAIYHVLHLNMTYPGRGLHDLGTVVEWSRVFLY